MDPDSQLTDLTRRDAYVRGLARDLCVGIGADPDDVAQQAWVRVLEHGIEDVERPRSWLKSVVRNVASNFARGEGRRRSHENASTPRTSAPSSAEIVEQEERRRRLVELVDRLPGAQRDVVWLCYFEGLPPRKVAARLELPVERVQNLKRRALDWLGRQLDQAAQRDGMSGRRAFLLPVIAIGRGVPESSVLSAPMFPGAILMTTKSKLVTVGAVLVAIAVYTVWSTFGAASMLPIEEAAPRTLEVVPEEAGERSTESFRPNPNESDSAPVPERAEVEAEVATAPPAAGKLVVSMFFKRDGQRVAAPGVLVMLGRTGEDSRSARRGRSDASGVVVFDGLQPGRVQVWDDRAGPNHGVDITAGETAELAIVLRSGMTLRGRVVDVHMRPIKGASVEVAMSGLLGRDPHVLAQTDAEGRFEVVGVPEIVVVSARAPGFASSKLMRVWREGNRPVEVEIVLPSAGGELDGLVLDPAGDPVEGALVKVGLGKLQGIHLAGQEPMYLPALVRTDATGRFRAFGLAPGEHPVQVRTEQFAMWSGSCSIAALATARIRVDLLPGASVRGVVRDEAGQPAPKVGVSVGEWQDFGRRKTRSGADGVYVVTGLPAGAVSVEAEHDDLGEARVDLDLKRGESRECDISLSRGTVLAGRVVDTQGKPVSNLFVEAVAMRTRVADYWTEFERTDADGRFALVNCPTDRPLRIKVSGASILTKRLEDVDASAGNLEVRVRRSGGSRGRIHGRVVGPDGLPLRGVRVAPWCVSAQSGPRPGFTDGEGSFDFRNLAVGEWRISVRSSDFPAVFVEPRVLAAGEAWDVGVVQFELGGRARIRAVEGENRSGTMAGMVESVSTGGRWVVRMDGDQTETPVLSAGDYRLAIWGANVAAQSIPFSIVSGRDTEVSVATKRGVQQRFEFAFEDQNAASTGGTLYIRRGEELVVDCWIEFPGGQPIAYEVALEPGATYRVSMVGERSGKAEITVPEAAARTTRITLR